MAIPVSWAEASVYHQHPDVWHHLFVGLKQADMSTPQAVPWPCWLCNRSLVGAFSQDRNDFLLTGRPVGSGPWVLPWAQHVLWAAQTSCRGLGPGQALPASVATGTRRYLCTSAEAPSSAHSGSSQLPTALSTTPSKDNLATGISPYHHIPSHFLAVCLVP